MVKILKKVDSVLLHKFSCIGLLSTSMLLILFISIKENIIDDPSRTLSKIGSKNRIWFGTWGTVTSLSCFYCLRRIANDFLPVYKNNMINRNVVFISSVEKLDREQKTVLRTVFLVSNSIGCISAIVASLVYDPNGSPNITDWTRHIIHWVTALVFAICCFCSLFGIVCLSVKKNKYFKILLFVLGFFGVATAFFMVDLKSTASYLSYSIMIPAQVVTFLVLIIKNNFCLDNIEFKEEILEQNCEI
ncbi:MAG: hypothetical protein LBU60_05975 [Clostridiales bacterium]|jgi:magnesium-transporting ATPase (P-type)|nr:hypothetical protein [Clostridiales bacterium]